MIIQLFAQQIVIEHPPCVTSYSRNWDTMVNKNKIATLTELSFYCIRNLKNNLWPLIARMASINGLPVTMPFVL